MHGRLPSCVPCPDLTFPVLSRLPRITLHFSGTPLPFLELRRFILRCPALIWLPLSSLASPFPTLSCFAPTLSGFVCFAMCLALHLSGFPCHVLPCSTQLLSFCYPFLIFFAVFHRVLPSPGFPCPHLPCLTQLLSFSYLFLIFYALFYLVLPTPGFPCPLLPLLTQLVFLLPFLPCFTQLLSFYPFLIFYASFYLVLP